MKLILLLLLACPAFSAEVPYFLRELESQKDIGAVNENFRALADAIKAVQTDVDANETTEAANNTAVGSTWTCITSGDQNVVATVAPGTTITGSTITTTFVGSSSFGMAYVLFTATHTSSEMTVDILVDSVRVSGVTGGVGIDAGAGDGTHMHSIPRPLGLIGAGAHSFSVVIWKSGGTLTIRKGSLGSPAFCFMVAEVR